MEMDLDIYFDRIKGAFLVAGIVIGMAGTFAATEAASNGDKASQNLVDFLENQSGQELEILQVEQAGKFYEVDLRDSQDQVVTYYTSQDGEMFTSAMQTREGIEQQNQALVNFQQCLTDSGTVMYGNSTQQATQTQVQRLGGAAVVQPIYRDVANQTVLQEAVQQGVQQVPAFVQNGNAVQGVQTLQQVEQFTGCQYTGN
jgi:hypothetical protein